MANLNLPYTFVGGTAAKAQEVNANFSQVKAYVEDIASKLEDAATDILELQSGKADLQGNVNYTFNVATPTASGHAVNKGYLDSQLEPYRYLIIGFKATKTGNQTLTVGPGGCYDSSYINPIVNNSNQSLRTDLVTDANGTYNIYVIATVSNSQVSGIVLTTGSDSPTIDVTGRIYRKIGTLTTDASNYIDTITQEVI